MKNATPALEGQRRILDVLNDGVFQTDRQGLLTYVNDALAHIHGYADASSMLGKSFLEFIPPGIRPSVEKLFRDTLDGILEENRIQLVIARCDGSPTIVEVKPVPLIEGGRTTGACGVVRDITDRRKTEEMLQLLSNAVMNSPDSVLITDRHGIIQFVNPAFERCSGFPRGDVIGKTPRILKSGAHDAAFYEGLWKTILSGQPFRATITNRKKNGELFTQEETISPIVDEEGTITHFISTGRDISREKLLEQQFLQAQKMEAVGRLAGGVAHDFNNILTAILGYSGLALEAIAPSHPLARDLEEIEKAGRRACGLTRQLLAFSRKQILQPRILDLNAVVTDVEKMLRRLIGENIELVTMLAPKLGPVRADPGHLEQILMNLAVNSRDAMPNGGKLILETQNLDLNDDYALRHVGVRPGPYVLLAVTDTGCGMSREVQSHLFEPFFTTKESGKGTGLGLSTVYGIVKQSGGNIWVYSEIGHGTTVKIYLPRIDALPEMAGTGKKNAKPGCGAETVLVVEDDGGVRALVRRTLQLKGYRILEASTPAQAREMVDKYADPIHLLLTDLIMPGSNGVDLANELRSKRPPMKALLMSGYTSGGILAQGLEELHYEFLDKPFTPDQLLHKVRAVLDGKSV